MLSPRLATPPATAPPAPGRLTWPEFAVILLAVALAVFLNVRGTPFLIAVAISAGTMAVFVGTVAVPRGLAELTRDLRILREAAEHAREVRP